LALLQNFNNYKSHAPTPQTYTDMAIWVMQISEHMEAAINILLEGEKLFPQNQEIAYNKHHLRAYWLNEHGNYPQSIQEGLAALAIKKAYPTLVNLGLAYAAINDYDKAIMYFDRAINDFGSSNGEVEFFRGQVYLVKGDVQHACADLQAAKSKNYPVDEALLKACR
jgi:tetratricopeptide (TPR) repeat protein